VRVYRNIVLVHAVKVLLCSLLAGHWMETCGWEDSHSRRVGGPGDDVIAFVEGINVVCMLGIEPQFLISSLSLVTTLPTPPWLLISRNLM
jgi:hypothetical protein